MLNQQEEVNVIYAVRYVALAAATAFVYHYFESLGRERKYVWGAPASFAKYVYLVSRHLIILTVLVTFVLISGFIGLDFSDDVCGWSLCIAVGIMELCLTLNSVLAVLHIITLWDFDRRIVYIMAGACFASEMTAFIALMISLTHMKAGLVWNAQLMTCAVLHIDELVTVVAAAPFAFELMMLLAITWNAFDRPRTSDLPLRRALVKDGFVFFIATASFRAVQVALVATRDPALSILGLVFVAICAFVSIMFNQRAFATRARRPTAPPPPGLASVDWLLSRDPQLKPAGRRRPGTPSEPIELGRVEMEIELRKD